MNSPLGFVESAVGVVLGRDHLAGRDLEHMTMAELEARAQTNEARLRFARQAGWVAGFGSGFFATVRVAKLMK